MEQRESLWLGENPLKPTNALRHILRLDTWSYKTALWNLMGLSESSIQTDHTLGSDGYPEDSWRVSISAFDNQKFEKSDDVPFDLDTFDEIELMNERLNEIWGSGNHLHDNPPDYYIRWAISKGFSIPRHQWAYENKLTATPISLADNTN